MLLSQFGPLCSVVRKYDPILRLISCLAQVVLEVFFPQLSVHVNQVAVEVFSPLQTKSAAPSPPQADLHIPMGNAHADHAASGICVLGEASQSCSGDFAQHPHEALGVTISQLLQRVLKHGVDAFGVFVS